MKIQHKRHFLSRGVFHSSMGCIGAISFALVGDVMHGKTCDIPIDFLLLCIFSFIVIFVTWLVGNIRQSSRNRRVQKWMEEKGLEDLTKR